MYTAIYGQNYRLKRLLAENAEIGQITTDSGPYLDFSVNNTYTYKITQVKGSYDDDKEEGFT